MTPGLIITAGKNTPRIEASVDDSLIRITGNSFPEDAKSFYQRIEDWFESQDFTQINFYVELNYIASSSLICLLNLMRTTIKKVSKENIHIEWVYETDDDDLAKIAEDFEKVLKVNLDKKAI